MLLAVSSHFHQINIFLITITELGKKSCEIFLIVLFTCTF